MHAFGCHSWWNCNVLWEVIGHGRLQQVREAGQEDLPGLQSVDLWVSGETRQLLLRFPRTILLLSFSL